MSPLHPCERRCHIAARCMCRIGCPTPQAHARPLARLETRRDPRASDMVVHQHSSRAEHGRAAVVELDVQLECLLLRIRVAHPILPRHIAGRLALGHGSGPRALVETPGANLHQTNEEEDLGEAERRDGLEACDTVREVSELDVRRGREVAWPAQARLRNVADSGHHRDAAMLDLDRAPASEFLGRRLGGQAQRIPKAQRSHGAKLRLEAHLNGRRAHGGSRRHRRKRRGKARSGRR
mmetsp:Transcript_25893/g.65839  ORF Transcript_25893/g.65839 Transcript_25893/m.65839 type:complete len:237 (+) Transcript_25893:251-961(+)